MSSKKKINEFSKEIPENLNDHPFFGITPDEDQKKLIDAVWKREKKVFLVDSIAGSGKTLIATALGVLMVKYGIYDKIIYITFPGIYEKEQGFLPGDLLSKSEPYFQPLYDALLTIGELPSHVCNTSQGAVEHGSAYIECTVATYMRGINIENAFVILDESENADLHTLAKVLSRINDNSLAMVIGHSGQCDLIDKTKSGFAACIDYQTAHHPELCETFTLQTNHRGWVSMWADLMLEEYEQPSYGFIYMTRNKITDKLYIGQHKRTMNPKDINDTWYFGSDASLIETIAKYGEENFERTILYECDSAEQLNYMEKIFVSYYKAVDDDVFYNIVAKGGLSKKELAKGRKDEPVLKENLGRMPETSKNEIYGEEIRKKLSEMVKIYLAEHACDEEDNKIEHQKIIGEDYLK